MLRTSFARCTKGVYFCTLMNIFLDDLSNAQREAVVNYQGPSLIIAGAGSGKTRVLTYRIAHMLQQGVLPWSVLALTFTNKAANEMKERIGKLVNPDSARRIWMGTFHSIFARILRSEAHLLGYPSTFTIYDTTDSKSLIRACIKELMLDEKIYKPGDVLGRISMAKNSLIQVHEYARNVQITAADAAARRPRIAEIYERYAQRCRVAGAMDFDDLLLNTNILFRDFPEALEKYRALFRYILVDEYQDTNYAQYLIVKKLAEPHHNLCVVGDDAQSIYSFRGARIENILNFRNDYSDYKEYKLEQNYRSTQTIVDAANSLIEKNSRRINKKCFSEAETGEKIGVLKAFTDQEEGFMVASSIAERVYRDRVQYNDFAILYRTNSQSRSFEDALRKHNIPYKIYGGISFYQRAEIKDLLAYLRLTVNPHDDEAFKRAVQVPSRGIGDTTMGRLQAFSLDTGKSIFETLQNVPAETIGLRAPAPQRLAEFTKLIAELGGQQFQQGAYDFAMTVAAKSGFLAELKNDKSPEGVARYENIEELFNSIREFCDNYEPTGEEETELITIHHYLENVALITDMDNEKKEDRNKVSLMTVHSAKGLEFPYVYVVGMEENLFPGSMSQYSPDDLEEERRLFYVAITRAGRKATVSFANSRYRWGEVKSNPPSRFLRDIDSHYFESSVTPDEPAYSDIRDDDDMPATPAPRRVLRPIQSAPRSAQPLSSRPTARPAEAGSFEASNPDDIREGMRVEHERFGFGEVQAIEGNSANKKAVVVFDSGGSKTLLLKFAKLKIV